MTDTPPRITSITVTKFYPNTGHCMKNQFLVPPQAGYYKSIVIDPPWDQGIMGKMKSRPLKHNELPYQTMTLDELAIMPIGDWASPDSFLWLWATNSRSITSGKPILVQAFDLMERWGYQYYTTITWYKNTGPCPFGPYQITTEHCLFGYRGKFKTPEGSTGKTQTAFYAPQRRHSEKPPQLYEHIQTYFQEPRLDVFARKQHPGFDAWGNQVEETTQNQFKLT